MTKEQAVEVVKQWGVHRSGALYGTNCGPGNGANYGYSVSVPQAKAFACYMLVERVISRVHTWVYSPRRIPDVLDHFVINELDSSQYVLMPPGEPYPHCLREHGLTKEDIVAMTLTKFYRALCREDYPEIAGGLPDVDKAIEAAG